MIHSAFIYLICAFGVFDEGQTALVQTQGTVMAAVGGEAHLSCQLMQSKDVVQVTWKKSLPEEEKNVATSHKDFGQRVNPDFRGRLEVRDAGLQSSSIVIKKVMEEDEGCYHCWFNAYPEGALKGTTCLQLYELHEPILHVESNTTEEAAVSCSATGRPAPTVTLRVLQQDLHFLNYSSVSVTNTNGTVTNTTTAVLSGFRDNSTQVGCAARVLSGPQIEALMMIPEVKQWSADGFDEESGSNDCGLRWIILLTVLICGCVAVMFLLLKRRNQNRDREMIEMIQSPIEDTQRTETPLVEQGNNQIKRRSTSPKSQASGDSSPSRSASMTP